MVFAVLLRSVTYCYCVLLGQCKSGESRPPSGSMPMSRPDELADVGDAGARVASRGGQVLLLHGANGRVVRCGPRLRLLQRLAAVAHVVLVPQGWSLELFALLQLHLKRRGLHEVGGDEKVLDRRRQTAYKLARAALASARADAGHLERAQRGRRC